MSAKKKAQKPEKEKKPAPPAYKTLDYYANGRVTCSQIRQTPEELAAIPTVAVLLYRGVKEVETGFFERFPSLGEASFPDTLRRLDLTPAEKALFARNHVTVRGAFDSCVDELARELGLPFLHCDIQIGWDRNEAHDETNIATLRFSRSGAPEIHLNNVTTGMSASSAGGGENHVSLPRDFYKTMSPTDLANLCWGMFYTDICTSEPLAAFLKKAKARGGYQRG